METPQAEPSIWRSDRSDPTSLADAQRQGATVRLEGGDGEFVYAIAPANLVHCDEDRLKQLLDQLEQIADNGKPAIAYRRGAVEPPDDQLGAMHAGIWVENGFDELGLSEPIRQVLEGRRERIPTWRRWIGHAAGALGALGGVVISDSLGVSGPAEPAIVVGAGVGASLLTSFVVHQVLSNR